MVPAGLLAGPGANVSKGLAQCKVEETSCTVPVTHLVASLSPLAFAQAKSWLRWQTLFNSSGGELKL